MSQVIAGALIYGAMVALLAWLARDREFIGPLECSYPQHQDWQPRQ